MLNYLSLELRRMSRDGGYVIMTVVVPAARGAWWPMRSPPSVPAATTLSTHHRPEMLPTMLNRHFAHPQGSLGRLVGRMMARKNAALTYRVIAAAGLRGNETVLEIGCGPGVGLVALAAALPHGQVLGAEPSVVMRQQAARRLRDYGHRVDLVDATADTLPWTAGTIDVVLAINNVQLWQPAAGSLARVHEVLVPGGHLLVGLSEHAVRSDGSTVPADVDSRLVSELATAGFDIVRQEWEPGGNGRELLVIARRGAR